MWKKEEVKERERERLGERTGNSKSIIEFPKITVK